MEKLLNSGKSVHHLRHNLTMLTGSRSSAVNNALPVLGIWEKQSYIHESDGSDDSNQEQSKLLQNNAACVTTVEFNTRQDQDPL